MNWYKKAIEQPTREFYHGTTTGTNNENIQNFIQNGIDPQRASGHGQGGGFYVFMDKASAQEYSNNLKNPNGWQVAGEGRGGSRMIIKFTTSFNPGNFDLDYEIESGYAMPFITRLWDIFKKIPDKQIMASVENMVLGEGSQKQNYSGEIYILPSKTIVINANKEQEEVDVHFLTKNGQEYNKVIGSQRIQSVNQGSLLGAICNHLEKSSPQEFYKIEQEQFNEISQYSRVAVKYIGPKISINPQSNIEVEIYNEKKWVDGQAYLNPQQPSSVKPSRTEEEPLFAKNYYWYKKAKLIDKRHHTDKDETTVKCMYCLRWATHPENEKVERNDYIWKQDKELDGEEHHVAQRSLSNSNVSSTICPRCKAILEQYNNKINPNKVKELSLMEIA